MQDEMLAATNPEVVVYESFLKKPKKFKHTQGWLIVWNNTNKFEEYSLAKPKDILPPIKYKKDFLHFYKHIDKYLDLNYSRILLLDQIQAEYNYHREIEVTDIITKSVISKSAKYLAFGLKNGMSKLWDVQLRRFGQTFDKHSKEVSAMGFYKDWILITGSMDGTVQMYDISIEGSGENSTFMAKKNFFTIVNKEKYLEDENSIVDLIVSNCGIVFVIDSQQNGRAYSVFHGQKVFKAIPGLHFSLENLVGGKNTKTVFQTVPFSIMTTNEAVLAAKCLKVDSDDNDSITGSCVQLFRYHDIVISNYEVLQEFIKLGTERSKIFEVFSQIKFEDLVNSNMEVVKKGVKNMKASMNIYSKGKFTDSYSKHSHSKLHTSEQGKARTTNASQLSSSKGLNNTANQSRVQSMANTTKEFSQFMETDMDKSSVMVDLNKTYKTVLAVDPADRMRPKKKQGSQPNSKLVYEEYTKPLNTFSPEEVYQPKENALGHVFTQLDQRLDRSKQVGQFMNKLQKEMEERRLKERREELKAKLNQKVPKKANYQDFLINKVF